MKSIFFAILFVFATNPAQAASITLQAGESINIKPMQDTTVTCAGAISGNGGTSKNPKAQKCSFSSDDACRGQDVGSLCARDEMRGTCVPKKSIRDLECSCLPF